MTKVRVGAFSISVDGFGAGPDQDLEHPLGVRGEELHQWAFATTTFRAMFGEEGGPEMWAEFRDELRTAHLGTPPTGRPSVGARLQAAYEAVKAG